MRRSEMLSSTGCTPKPLQALFAEHLLPALRKNDASLWLTQSLS
jgi:hypothetical protein